jgi:uncharacterized protein with FMN-binding domain
MSAKTKIVVLRMKELVFTGVLVVLAILLIILLLAMFLPKKEQSGEAVTTMTYTPGVYTSSVMLNDTAVDVQVIVDENNINSISLVNLDETVETMYPLVKPAMEELSQQIIDSQSLENITYSTNNQYTSIVLLNAIKDTIEKASLE